MNPCKHLDHSDTYAESCKLVTIVTEGMIEAKYWKRLNVPYEGAPVNVQFCGQGRGRINSIFNCYDGSLSCYEPGEPHGQAAKEGA